MQSRIGKFLALPFPDQRLLVRAWGNLLLIRAALLTMPLARVRRIAAPRSRPHTAGVETARIAWAVDAVRTAVPGGGNCLVRALATQRLLRRAGYDSELKIGISRAAPGAIQAHAWLESGGKTVIGAFELDEYAAMMRPEATAPARSSR